MKSFTKVIITLLVLTALTMTSSASGFLNRQHDEVWSWVGQMTNTDVSSVLTTPVESNVPVESAEPEEEPDVRDSEAEESEPEEDVSEDAHKDASEPVKVPKVVYREESPAKEPEATLPPESSDINDLSLAPVSQTPSGYNDVSLSPGDPELGRPIPAKAMTELEAATEKEQSFLEDFKHFAKSLWSWSRIKPSTLLVALMIAAAFYLWDRRKDRKE